MVGVSIGLTDNQQKTLEGLELKIFNGKPLTDKQQITLGELLAKKNAKPTLSQTTKSYLHQLHKEELFNRRKEISSKYLDKGIQVEEQSITLYSNVSNKFFIKNKKRFSNDFITGEPDNIQGKVRDIKSSWDFSTFPLYETGIPNQDYYWQLQGYMALTLLDKAELIYCLVDTPEMIVDDEKRRTGWKLGFIELPEELEKEIEENMSYADIPNQIKVKVFPVQKDEKGLEALYAQIEICRDYLSGLSVQIIENQFKEALA